MSGDPRSCCGMLVPMCETCPLRPDPDPDCPVCEGADTRCPYCCGEGDET